VIIRDTACFLLYIQKVNIVCVRVFACLIHPWGTAGSIVSELIKRTIIYMMKYQNKCIKCPTLLSHLTLTSFIMFIFDDKNFFQSLGVHCFRTFNSDYNQLEYEIERF
jgi:hypothetical protein